MYTKRQTRLVSPPWEVDQRVFVTCGSRYVIERRSLFLSIYIYVDTIVSRYSFFPKDSFHSLSLSKTRLTCTLVLEYACIQFFPWRGRWIDPSISVRGGRTYLLHVVVVTPLTTRPREDGAGQSLFPTLPNVDQKVWPTLFTSTFVCSGHFRRGTIASTNTNVLGVYMY